MQKVQLGILGRHPALDHTTPHEHATVQVTVDLYGHFIPGADRHHVEGLAADIEARRTQQDAARPRPADSFPRLSSRFDGAPGRIRTFGH